MEDQVSDGPEWWQLAPKPETVQQINEAVDRVLGNSLSHDMNRDNCKFLIEAVAATLKDEDPEWIDFEDAPRTNTNPIYSCIYQKLYKRLPKAPISKEVKHVAKKDNRPVGKGNVDKDARDETQAIAAKK